MWDDQFDLIIIGSGFAGLAAALEAANTADLSILVCEKMRVPGGNSTISGGLVAAAGSVLQEESGITDTPELMLEDMLRAGCGLNDPALAAIVAEHSAEALAWTMDLGVRYKPKLSHLGGHTLPRTCNTVETSGSGIVKQLLAACRNAGVELHLRTRLEHFIMDEFGDVEGVEVREDYRFPHEESGTVRRFRARKGVILASGGFSKDQEFRSIQNPSLSPDVESTNQPGATAEALVAALATGATPVQLSEIQLGPWAPRDEEGFGFGSMFSLLAGFPYGILIDQQTGRRFVNELTDRRLLVDAMLNNGHEALAIVDHEGVRYATTLNSCLKRGVVQKFDSITELAAAHRVDLPSLEQTITTYNKNVLKGVDEEFGKPLPPDLSPIQTPPFYSIRLVSKVHHCMGGIRIDTDARVLGLTTGRPIGRLYAAGEITGGIHGACRLGSNAIPECLVFGRIAGRNAAGEKDR